MLTGNAEIEMAMNAINEAGVYKFILKPWTETSF
jgi:FixJ family two-component response regulator